MYKIYCYTETAEKLFDYESSIIPMVGDSYSNPSGLTGNWDVTRRLLHTTTGCTHVISLWLKQTNKP